MFVSDLSKVTIDSAAAGIEPAISNRSQVQRPNHCATEPHLILTWSTLTSDRWTNHRVPSVPAAPKLRPPH